MQPSAASQDSSLGTSYMDNLCSSQCKQILFNNGVEIVGSLFLIGGEISLPPCVFPFPISPLSYMSIQNVFVCLSLIVGIYSKEGENSTLIEHWPLTSIVTDALHMLTHFYLLIFWNSDRSQHCEKSWLPGKEIRNFNLSGKVREVIFTEAK